MAAIGQSRRYFDGLARPKSVPEAFNEQRSIYWNNACQRKDYSKPTYSVLTPRLQILIKPKTLHPNYHPALPSPIWVVSPAARRAICTEYVAKLSEPKTTHPDYRPPKSIHTIVSRRALSASPSKRLHELAYHKSYAPLKIKSCSEWDWGEWTSDMNTTKIPPTTGRVDNLAEPKHHVLEYKPPRDIQWKVPPTALKHTASDRLNQLSQCKQIPGFQEDYNPNRWHVSRAALRAKPSPTIENLAHPIPRKCVHRK